MLEDGKSHFPLLLLNAWTMQIIVLQLGCFLDKIYCLLDPIVITDDAQENVSEQSAKKIFA